MRNINIEEKEIKEIFTDFSKEINNGIPNLFGEQRFGGIRQITHLVGKLFLQGKIKDAVLLYLSQTHELENPETTKARELVSAGDYKEAYKAFKGRNFRYERSILMQLLKEPNDFVGAFQQLPKNLVFLFPHAYQAFLFNNYLKERYKKLGNKMFGLQEGDITDENKNILGPLFGFDSVFAKEIPGELEHKVLNDEKITLDNFRVKSFPQLSASGGRRQIKLMIKDLKLLEIGKDEFFEGANYLKISFSLPKATYATTALEELMKTNAPK